jgi:NosR/NirI family transcriptional regulator, nitrous oxide reductase regulator
MVRTLQLLKKIPVVLVHRTHQLPVQGVGNNYPIKKKIKMDLLKRRKFNADRFIGVIAFVTIIIAWILGANRTKGEVLPSLQVALPQANSFEILGNGIYAAYQDDPQKALIGYVAVGEATGYGGPMRVAVATDLQGNVLGLAVIDNKETPSWFQRVKDSDYIQSFLGKKYLDAFQLGSDVDGITGATYTSRAIAEAALKGSRAIAEKQLGLTVPKESPPKIQFGIPEITLIGLYVIGFFGHQQKFKFKKQIRWLSMLAGLIVLGFIYTRPLTLSDISKFLLGFWPQWQTNLYWYLLIGGILFVFTVDNKNPYCEWFCPFGAAQECMGAIGGAKPGLAGKNRSFLKWLQRGLAWLAILLALLFRNPGLTSYEVFGTLFDLKGTSLQFALLGIVLIASLFIRRPWCTYLCPLRPVTDFYRLFRKWILESWTAIRRKKAGS